MLGNDWLLSKLKLTKGMMFRSQYVIKEEDSENYRLSHLKV